MHSHLQAASRDLSFESSLRQIVLNADGALPDATPTHVGSAASAIAGWLERYLNQLQMQGIEALAEASARSAGLDDASPTASIEPLSDMPSIVERVGQVLVTRLSDALEHEVVAIVERFSAGSTQGYLVQQLAGAMVQLSPAVCIARQTLEIERGSFLSSEDFERLQTSRSPSVWQLTETTWLVTLSTSVSAELTEIEDEFLQVRSQLMTRAIAQFRPILRQAQHWQTLQASYNALRDENQDLTQTNKLKSEFLANTSHEIRTPLSSILGFTHLLREQGYNPSSPRHQEYLKIILSSGQHLLALINDILDLSKIEANQLDLQLETAAIEPLCQIALKLVQEKANDKGLGLKLNIAPEVTMVNADPLRLKQMLFNLLSNALKFTTRGSVGLDVQAIEGMIRFTVWDTGTGISDEQQQLLFRPYTQLTNARRGEGTGLGLTLTKKLVELHGGTIQVTSVLNEGSKFTIALPIPIEDIVLEEPPVFISAKQPQTFSPTVRLGTAPPTLPSAVSAPLPTDPGLQSLKRAAEEHPIRPYHILLVEDNIHNARLLITYLCKLGYEVTWAQDSVEMWNSLKQSLPALILMDIHLPGADGLSLTQALQAQERYRSIPVIIQTAMAMKGDRERCLESGACSYISKPIDLSALAHLIETHRLKA